MDICHLKNAELEAKHQKYKGRVVLRGDIVKDDSGSFAVRTEQGSSAAQMTAAKVMDIISRLPGCAGQVADAVSAYTQLMEEAPKLLKIPKSDCPVIWVRRPRHKWPKSWSSMEDPVVPLERNLYGHPVERNKTLIRCGMYSTKKLIWENDHLSSIMCTWAVLKKQCEISKDIVDNYRTMFESRISAGATENLPCSENLCISSWSYDMEGNAKKYVERYCELANRTTQQLYKVSTPCIIHVNTNSIVMWQILPNNADWDCLKTPILQEILRIQNLHQVELCAFSEAIRLFQSVGCVRNKLQFRTVQQNQKSFLWMQD